MIDHTGPRTAAEAPTPLPLQAPLQALAAACLLLALVPALLAGFLAWSYAVDVPMDGQWSMVEDLLAAARGEWEPGDVIRAHDGHRIATTRLVVVPLGLLSGWNTRYEVVLSWLAAAALLLVLAVGFASAPPGRAGSDWPGLLALAGSSLAVFSLAQWESWLTGALLPAFLAVLFAAAASLALSAWGLRWSGWSAGAALAALASFSHAAGWAVWPVGLVALAARPGPVRRRAALGGAWATLAIVLLAAFPPALAGGADAGGAAQPRSAGPGDTAVTALGVLGAPVVGSLGSASPPRASAAAPVAGGLLLAISALLLTVAWRRRSARESVALFPAALLLLALGFALQVALERARAGMPGTIASRDVTLVAVAWAATITLAVRAAASPAAGRGRRPWWAGWAGGWAAAACLALLASSVASLPEYPKRQAQLAPARQALADGGPQELLALLHPEVGRVTAELPVLRAHRLSVFRSPRGWRPPPMSDALSSFDQRLAALEAPAEVPAGARFVVPVEVVNPGPEEWPATGESAQPVNLSYHWIPLDGGGTVAGGLRTSLRRGLEAGESAVLQAQVEAPSAPGAYTLRLSMVQETVDWFDHRGAPPLDLALRVMPAAPGAGAP